MDEQHEPVDVAPGTNPDFGDATMGADLDIATAEQEIAEAVSARHSIARRYVSWVRRRHPDATPAEVVGLLERQYVTAISSRAASRLQGPSQPTSGCPVESSIVV